MTGRFLLYATPFLLLFIALSLFEPYLYINVFGSSEIKPLSGKEFKVIAHKGDSKHAPENTLAAIQNALDLRVDMIELDVRHTKDEELIVFHDQFLDRVTRDSEGKKVSGDVHDFTLAELKEFEVGSWFATPFTNQKIPTLKEALDLVYKHNSEENDDVIVLLEIKHMDHPHYHDFSEKIVEVIKTEPDGEGWIYVQSYENEYLEDIHELDSLVQTKLLIIGEDSPPLIAFYSETRIHLGHAKVSNRMKALNPHYETLSPRRIFRMHAAGYEVFAYPVNDRDHIVKMLNAGVDGIISDDPGLVIEIRNAIRELTKAELEES